MSASTITDDANTANTVLQNISKSKSCHYLMGHQTCENKKKMNPIKGYSIGSPCGMGSKETENRISANIILNFFTLIISFLILICLYSP